MSKYESWIDKYPTEVLDSMPKSLIIYGTVTTESLNASQSSLGNHNNNNENIKIYQQRSIFNIGKICI